MSEIKLVVADVDGTILDDNHQLDNQLKDTLKLLQEKNIHFVLSSARPPNTMYDFTKELSIQHQPLACYNGALILEQGDPEQYKAIFNHLLQNEEANEIVELIEEEFPEISINLYSDENWYVNKYDEWSELETSITGETPEKRDLRALTKNPNSILHKLLLIGTTEEIKKLYQRLEKVELTTSSYYLSKENYMEVTHKDVSKERALTELADYFDLSLENTLAIGDNFNDLPMLLLAGVGVAMENGPTEVKTQVEIVTGNNNENGASRALREHVLKE